MDLRFNGNSGGSVKLTKFQQLLTNNRTKTEESPKQPAQKVKGDERDCAPILNCDNILEEIDMPVPNVKPEPEPEPEQQQNNTLENLSPGLNTFEYGGARLDLFKRKNIMLKQFVTPQNFNMKDFVDNFPDLKEVIEVEPEPEYIDKTTTEDISYDKTYEISPNEPEKTSNIRKEEISEPETVNKSVEVQNKTQVTKPTQTNPSVATINGEIDETVIQGSTGDCWIISALLSLSSTTEGKELIKNSITVNDDSSVTISFKGLGVSYTISPDEISKHDTDKITSDAYSNGDNDVLAFELATEKLRADIKSGKIKINSSNGNITYAGDGKGIDDGGLPVQMLYYLTGIESDELYNKDLSNLSADKLNAVLDKANNDDNTVLSFVVYGRGHGAKLIDGSTYSLSLKDEGHALAITDITNDTVTFVNPWDSGVSYTMTRSEFAKLGICYICSTDLNKTSLKDNSVDITQNSSNTITQSSSVFKRTLRNFSISKK